VRRSVYFRGPVEKLRPVQVTGIARREWNPHRALWRAPLVVAPGMTGKWCGGPPVTGRSVRAARLDVTARPVHYFDPRMFGRLEIAPTTSRLGRTGFPIR